MSAQHLPIKVSYSEARAQLCWCTVQLLSKSYTSLGWRAAHLKHAEHLGQGLGIGVDGGQEHEEVVRGGVREHLQVIGRVLVMRGHVQRHHLLQERLGRLVVAEQGVPIHVEREHAFKSQGSKTLFRAVATPPSYCDRGA